MQTPCTIVRACGDHMEIIEIAETQGMRVIALETTAWDAAGVSTTTCYYARVDHPEEVAGIMQLRNLYSTRDCNAGWFDRIEIMRALSQAITMPAFVGGRRVEVQI